MRSFIIVLVPKYQAKEVEVRGACGMHEREEKLVQDFDEKIRRKETTRKTEA
jgi:hypothetical protein